MIIFNNDTEVVKEIHSVKELINHFDQIQDKPLYINYIGWNIQSFGQDNQSLVSKQDFVFEDLAFSIEENRNTEAWGTRFGPIIYDILPDCIIEKPKFDEITSDAILYWEQRINEVSNPVIKLHYQGLVYTFKEKVTGQACSEAMLRDYVKTIIDASKGGWELDNISVDNHLPIAFEIAKTYQDLLPVVKAEYLRLTNDSELVHVNVWTAYLSLIIDNIAKNNLFDSTEKQNLVQIIENRLTSLISLKINALRDKQLNPEDVKYVAEILATYYKQTNKKGDKERVVSYIEQSYRKYFSQGEPAQRLAWLQIVQQSYFKFNMTEQAQSLYPEIQNAGIEAKKHMETTSSNIKIPQEKIDKLIGEICRGSEDDIFNSFENKMMPKHKDSVDFVKRQAMNPLEGMMGTQIISEAGLPLSVIGSPSHDQTGNEYRFCAKFIESEEIVMRKVVQQLQQRQVFTKDKIVEHIMRSDLISSDRRNIIEMGVECYLNGNGIIACHLLIPQIEHAICSLALIKDAQAIRLQPTRNGYMVQLMDKLFDVNEVHSVLGDDVVFYLRTLLTEQRGLNLRNLLCHGLINPSYFDMNKADRIIHALLIIGDLTF